MLEQIISLKNDLDNLILKQEEFNKTYKDSKIIFKKELDYLPDNIDIFSFVYLNIIDDYVEIEYDCKYEKNWCAEYISVCDFLKHAEIK